MGKWKIRENTLRHIADNNTEIIIEGSGAAIARMNDGWDNPTIRANAERIVKAVNCHDDLVEALKIARDTIEALHGEVAWDIYDKHSPEMNAINKALAKAEAL